MQWTGAAFGAILAVGVVYWLFRNRRRHARRRRGRGGTGVVVHPQPCWGGRGRRVGQLSFPEGGGPPEIELACILDAARLLLCLAGSGAPGWPSQESPGTTPREHQRDLSGALPVRSRVADSGRVPGKLTTAPCQPTREQMERLEEDRLELEEFLKHQEGDC